MKLRNILIVVKNIEKSKRFYHDLFGLDTILDNDGNVILTEDGLYYIPADATVTFFQRFSDIPIYIGSWVENAGVKS